MNVLTCISPVNIAVIKYWGKRNENLILPLNDSLSTTLSTEHMHAKTTVMASSEFTEDIIWLNGKEESFDNPRLQNCLKEIRKRAREKDGSSVGRSSWHVHICSENNFPTAAGLASSAAGYACLVYTLAHLYDINGDITGIARQGSGSACRSILGGFVRWHSGSADDGSDSVAKQVASTSHWPELRVLILVVNDKQKKVSSTSGMQRSVETSELLKYRVSHSVPERLDAITQAILSKDFNTFAEITMKDSNQFHAVCLDTFPPAVYMNDVSHAIVHVVHRYNAIKGGNKVAYTFDAGPNACLYLLEPEVPTVVAMINHIFPPPQESKEYVRGIAVEKQAFPQALQSSLCVEPQESGLLKYIIHTKVGSGPQILTGTEQHLLDVTGQPKVTKD